jgi:hypothetical protein
MRAQVEQSPPSIRDLVPSLPPALDEVILQALAKEKEDRLASAAEFRAALEEAVGKDALVPPVTGSPGADASEPAPDADTAPLASPGSLAAPRPGTSDCEDAPTHIVPGGGETAGSGALGAVEPTLVILREWVGARFRSLHGQPRLAALALALGLGLGLGILWLATGDAPEPAPQPASGTSADPGSEAPQGLVPEARREDATPDAASAPAEAAGPPEVRRRPPRQRPAGPSDSAGADADGWVIRRE